MNVEKQKEFNFSIFAVLVIYPLLILVAVVAYCIYFDPGWFELSLAVIGYYGSNISVGVGLHRLWSHAAYKTNRVVEFVLALFAAGTLQGPILSWASNHRLHHTYTDQSGDPHSPLRYKSKFKGFLWSHIGWMMYGDYSYKKLEPVTVRKLGRNEILKWQLKNYVSIAVVMNTIVPALFGYALGGDLRSALAGFLFIGIARAAQQQMTFCVNSLCHFIGSKSYVDGTAGDIWWLFMLLLGENWHNFHHAFARDYRNGCRWYHPDVHKWIIYLMSKVGLAWDLVRTSPERISARRRETKVQVVNRLRSKLVFVEEKAREIALAARTRLQDAERSASAFAGQTGQILKNNIAKVEKMAAQLADKARLVVHQASSPKERIVCQIYSQLQRLEELSASIALIK